jgi:hypothetical protein
MPLQNRVAPNGDIFATSAKGTLLGNRGGKFHRDDKTLGKRRWASMHWICCELHWTPECYDAAIDFPEQTRFKVLTPPLITAILAKGYQPRWHQTALQWDMT